MAPLDCSTRLWASILLILLVNNLRNRIDFYTVDSVAQEEWYWYESWILENNCSSFAFLVNLDDHFFQILHHSWQSVRLDHLIWQSSIYLPMFGTAWIYLQLHLQRILSKLDFLRVVGKDHGRKEPQFFFCGGPSTDWSDFCITRQDSFTIALETYSL